jgi:hypothetical protein
VPGATGPSLEDFVDRIHRRVEAFALEHGDGQAAVEIELRDGALLRLMRMESEPGYGFVTLRPYTENDEPSEVIVPVGAIAAVWIRTVEEHPPFGFTASGERE